MSTICPHIARIQLTRPTGSNRRVRGLPRSVERGCICACASPAVERMLHNRRPAHRRRTDSPSSSMRNVPYVPLSSGQQEADDPVTAPGLKERRVISAWRR